MDYNTIIRYAWMAYDSSRVIRRITDISAQVSTNHVYRLQLEDGNQIIAKLSLFGNYEHFVEDHTIINVLSNNLPVRYENFLSRALMKGDKLFFHRFQNDLADIWVVFYRPIQHKLRLPKRLTETQIVQLGEEFAHFHKACYQIRNTLPQQSKTMTSDIEFLLNDVDRRFPKQADIIKDHCDRFMDNVQRIDAHSLEKIPVFVDWNIGNFSVTASGKFYSRWDYDWFRMSSRIVDFYFISRVVSDAGDRTVFTYNMSTLKEDRFLLFLRAYHACYPLTEQEILFIPEAYRFFLLHYVIRLGKYFFKENFAKQLQQDVFDTHLNSIADFKTDSLLQALESPIA